MQSQANIFVFSRPQIRIRKNGMDSPVKIFSGSASRYLAEKISEVYGNQLGMITFTRFSDGEFQPAFEESVRGSDMFIIQSTFPPAENLLELLLLIDAAKRASARHIVAVIPYMGYARQDRKDKPRVAIGAKLVANLLQAAGATRIMTMDLHADQIQGFFDVPVDHLYSSSIFIPYIQSLNLVNLTIAAPDMGGSKRANAYSKYLDCNMAICYKERKVHNQVARMTLIGEVEDRDVVLIDDLIDTAGTITMAADMIMERGARSVRAFCTHPVLSGNAIERIEKSQLTELVVTDTIPLKQESSKIKVLSVANLFADVVSKVHNYESISSNFIC
jgi:ribose-phosphate pyrophosphokinase